MALPNSTPGSSPHLVRSIGLGGAVALVVGGVIGAGIYALIGPIGAQTGHAIWLAFLIAMGVSIAGSIPCIQLASALPRAGAGYMFGSRFLAPIAGTVTAVWVVLAGTCSTCVVTLALVKYMPFGANNSWPHETGIAVLLVFFAINSIGVRFAMGVQIAMAAQMVLALALYIVVGIAEVPFGVSLTPRGGAGGFVLALVLAYNTCMGFQIIAELGEDIRDARRTIPLALLIGGGIVAVIYILVGIIFVNSLPYEADAYKADNAPLGASAALLLSPALASFVNFGAVTASLTSLNAAVIAIPRELYAMARDRILPPAFSKLGRRTQTPYVCELAFFALAIGLIACHKDIDFYGYMTAVGIQVMTTVLCVAAMRLESTHPEVYASAYIRFPRWSLWFCATIGVLASLGFVALVAAERPSVIVIYGGLTIAACVFHAIRVARLGRRGIVASDALRAISPETDSAIK